MTSMHDPNALEVSVDQARALRETGGLLVWHEPDNRVMVTDPYTIPGEDVMIIAGSGDLGPAPSNDKDLADYLSGMAEVRYIEWRPVKAMTADLVRVRRAMHACGIHVTSAPATQHNPSLRRYWISDEYTPRAFPRLTVKVMIVHDYEELSLVLNKDFANIQIINDRILENFALEIDSLPLGVAAQVIASATNIVLEHVAST